MKIKNHRLQDINFLESPNFNDRPIDEDISLLAVSKQPDEIVESKFGLDKISNIQENAIPIQRSSYQL